jgi:hypothetical protein
MGDGSYDVTQRTIMDVHWQAPAHHDVLGSNDNTLTAVRQGMLLLNLKCRSCHSSESGCWDTGAADSDSECQCIRAAPGRPGRAPPPASGL